MSLLRRLLGAAPWHSRAMPLDRPGQPGIDHPTEERWGDPDGSWFEGKLLSYEDPLGYAPSDLADLAHVREDVVWLEKSAHAYPTVNKFHSFHDQADRPVMETIAADLPSTRPAAYIMARSDVALSGYRAFIGRNGRYNLDESFTTADTTLIETARLGHPETYRNEMIGFKDTPQPAVFRFDTHGKAFAEIREPVICISSNEAPNYGSFLFRIFPKLIHVARLNPSMKLLVPMYFSSMISFLHLEGIEKDRIIPQYLDHVYYLDRAIVPSMRNRDLWLDDETLAFYDGLRARYAPLGGNRRIYLTRRNLREPAAAIGRVMINEAAVIAELEARGFDVIEPETLSPLQQIEVFASAAIIVAAGGSALFNTVFCRPGTKLIDIEAEPHWVGGHSRIFKSRGLDYGIFEGTPVTYDFSKPHIAFSIDIRRLRRRLDLFL